MNCSTQGSSVLHCLLEFAKIHVQWVGDANYLILCCHLLLLPSVFPSIRVFQWVLIYLVPNEGHVKILIAVRSVLWETSNLFTIDRCQLLWGHQTQCLFYNYQLVGRYFYMPIFFFYSWAVLMSTHEIVTAPLGLMNPYNCCTNILNLIACNVVNTLLSVPMRRAVAWIIRNSGKPKII